MSNTYHLHVRPGDQTDEAVGRTAQVYELGQALFLRIPADFRYFRSAKLRKIKEEGVYFNSHVDGHKIFMGPEESMQIQSNLGSTIAMAFDECPSSDGQQRVCTEFCRPHHTDG